MRSNPVPLRPLRLTGRVPVTVSAQRQEAPAHSLREQLSDNGSALCSDPRTRHHDGATGSCRSGAIDVSGNQPKRQFSRSDRS